MYFYESHLGGIYTSDEEYSYDDLYCEECGDSDTLIGEYDSWEDLIREIKVIEIDYGDHKEKDIEGPGLLFYSLDYIIEMSGLDKERIREINPEWVEFEEKAEEEFLKEFSEEDD